jgi:glutaconate CoA-transferase subunit A
MAPSYRRTVQSGGVQAQEHACYTVIAGLRAAIQGVPFMPVAGLTGSDLPAARDFRLVADPYSGESVVAIPALLPDVALIHVHQSDQFGNAVIRGSIFEDLLMVQAAKTVILTAEEIVDGSAFDTDATTISSLYVSAVVESPRGAWPFGMDGHYAPDVDHMLKLVTAGGDPLAVSAFIDSIVNEAVPS